MFQLATSWLPECTEFPDGSVIFQDDSIRIHQTQTVKEWFTEQKRSLSHMDWPPHSPDPTENLWDVSKKTLRSCLISKYINTRSWQEMNATLDRNKGGDIAIAYWYNVTMNVRWNECVRFFCPGGVVKSERLMLGVLMPPLLFWGTRTGYGPNDNFTINIFSKKKNVTIWHWVCVYWCQLSSLLQMKCALQTGMV